MLANRRPREITTPCSARVASTKDIDVRKVLGDTALRKLVVLAISLLLIHQAGALLWALFGAMGGIASAAVVACVSLVCGRLARIGAGNTAWLLGPTILFTVIPLAIKIWRFATDDQGWFDKTMDLVPFLVGFLIPVLLLALVYAELRSRERKPVKNEGDGVAPK